MSATLREVIQPVQFELEKILETDDGFLTLLVSTEIITDHQQSRVQVITSSAPLISSFHFFLVISPHAKMAMLPADYVFGFLCNIDCGAIL